MLLIITHTEDYTVDYVANILNKRELPFLRLNTDLLADYSYKITAGLRLNISVNGQNDFSGMWFRRVKLPDINHSDLEVQRFVALDYESLLFNLISGIDFKNTISEPYNVYRAENKVYQYRMALNSGLKLPYTLLTNSKDELINFIDNQPSIVKPLRTGRILKPEGNHLIYTNRINSSSINADTTLTPTIYQEEIEKEFEVRVTVVGESVFAAKVNSQEDLETALDWRRKYLKFEPYNLPATVSSKCIGLVKSMGLSFGAIDLICTPKSEYYFLEINQNGQWVWVELDTGLPISDALINYLYNGL